jgi:sulfate permease, SulP family
MREDGLMEETHKEGGEANGESPPRLEFFPLGRTLRDYSWAKARADARAAVNVALLDFPQSMAYALLAGLPVQFGVFCSALSSLTGPVLASSRFVMLGPTNATAAVLMSAFLTLGYSPAQAVAAMPVLLLLVAAFMIGGAFLRIASITAYISRSVVTGYITAAACLIIVNQLKASLGMSVERAGTFLESANNLIGGLGTVDWRAALVSGVTLGIYLLLRRVGGPRLPLVALTLVLASAVAAVMARAGIPVAMLDAVHFSGWPLSLPVPTWSDFNELANAALAVTFLSLLESTSISKSLAAQVGDRIDLNQQMLSIGGATLVGAFGSGMPVSGSLTRTILNYRSGARTPVASMISGSILVAGLIVFGGLIRFIPQASLAVMVIIVGVSLINIPQIRVMLRTTKSDAAVLLSTLIGGLVLPLDTAIYLGAVLSIALFVRKAARPELREIAFDETGNLTDRISRTARPEVAIVHVEGDLFFASSDLFLEQARRLAESSTRKVIILRLRNARHLDASAALAIQDFIRFARTRGSEVLVSGARPSIEQIFVRSGLMAELGRDKFFLRDPENPNVSTRSALKKAQEIIGGESADITIFAAEKEAEA